MANASICSSLSSKKTETLRLCRENVPDGSLDELDMAYQAASLKFFENFKQLVPEVKDIDFKSEAIIRIFQATNPDLREVRTYASEFAYIL